MQISGTDGRGVLGLGKHHSTFAQLLVGHRTPRAGYQEKPNPGGSVAACGGLLAIMK